MRNKYVDTPKELVGVTYAQLESMINEALKTIKPVTVILTSSGRFDLLRITIESFLKFNTYPIKHWVINDDSGLSIPYELVNDFPFIEWFPQLPRVIIKNQIASLDLLWSKVTTPYAMVLEDDWEFTREGFIEDSMRILEDEDNDQILQVWLIQPEEHNVSPIQWGYGNSEFQYGIFKRMPQLWSWHRFNPSLKRLEDYKRIAPFSKHTAFNPAKPWKAEADISQVYHKLGYTAGILPEAYMIHRGEGRHVGV